MPNNNSGKVISLFPEGYRLTDRLSKKLNAEWSQPEGKVRAQWVAKLINEYGYSQEQLALNVAAGAGRDAEKSTIFADIVAYRDKRRREPFLVVETKAPTESRGGIFKKCVNSQAVYPLSEQHGLEAQERR